MECSAISYPRLRRRHDCRRTLLSTLIIETGTESRAARPYYARSDRQTAYRKLRYRQHRDASLWKNGYFKSSNAPFCDQVLDGENFYSHKRTHPIIEEWRKHYNTVTPHNVLRYQPSASESIAPLDHKTAMH